MTNDCKAERWQKSPAILLLLFLACVVPTISARAESIDDDFNFASGLVEMGFPDYAQKVVDALLRAHPEQADRANLVKAQSLIATRKFAEAEALVASMPAGSAKTDAVKLALANGYFGIRDVDKAKQLYIEFFQSHQQLPTDPDLLRFYRESAYRFGQMLEEAGDLAGAARAYGKVIASNPEKEIARQMMADQADLYVRLARGASGDEKEKYLKDATKVCEDIQWGGVDIPFGKSIITMANIQLVRGDKAKAQKTISDYMDMLKQIDKLLTEQGLPLSMSPMAGARFLMGEICQQQGDALAKDPNQKDAAVKFLGQALNEYYRVFVDYGQSDWGPDAGVRAKTVEAALRALGKDVKIDLGAKKAEVEATQFRLADNLYRQKKFDEAAKEYVKTLNQFPEGAASVRALGTLMQSYGELGDTLMVKAVAEYVGERFPEVPEGAIDLLALGKFYFDKNNPDMYTYAYDTYLKYYPQHDRAGTILFTLAGLRKKAGDTMGANAYYERIVKNYPKDQYYPKALTQVAWNYYQSEQFDKAIAGFQQYVKDTQAGPEQALAQFSLADCFMRLNKLPEAAAEYEKLIGWLAPKVNPYASTPADAEKNKQLLEKAVFQRAYCYARIKEPADQVAAFRDKGLRGYDQFLAAFPDSPLAPKALRGKGAIQLDLGQKEAAAATFDALAAKYPQSEEGRNALFSLASSAMEIGQYDQGKAAFDKMMQKASTYSPEEFVRLGQLMLDNKFYNQAILAYQQVQASKTEERSLLERALYGIGAAYNKSGQHDQAIKALEDLLTRYPKSGLFYDAKFLLGDSYRETGRLDDATQALSDVFRYATDTVLINRASMTLGSIQRKQGDLAGALASYQRVALLADPSKPELRPMVEEAIRESVDVAMQANRFADAIDSCDQYLKLFPGSDKVEQIRRLRADANLKASQASAAPPAKAPAEGQ